MGRMVYGTNGLHVVRTGNGTNSLVIRKMPVVSLPLKTNRILTETDSADVQLRGSVLNACPVGQSSWLSTVQNNCYCFSTSKAERRL